MRKAAEVHLYDAAEVEKALREAVQLVDDLDVPDDLRVAAFTHAYGSLTQKQVVMEQVSPAGIVLRPGGQG